VVDGSCVGPCSGSDVLCGKPMVSDVFDFCRLVQFTSLPMFEKLKSVEFSSHNVMVSEVLALFDRW
jgi:hypothetical protein